MPTNRELYEPTARAWADWYGLPADGYVALIGRESGWNPYAVNPSSGAAGLAQIMAPTAADLGVDPMVPSEALEGGARYLGWLQTYLERRLGFPPSWAMVLAAYNWGPGNVGNAVEDHGNGWLDTAPAETRAYVAALAPIFDAATPGPGGSSSPSTPGGGAALILAALVGLAVIA